jgi:hypothetical protein
MSGKDLAVSVLLLIVYILCHDLIVPYVPDSRTPII